MGSMWNGSHGDFSGIVRLTEGTLIRQFDNSFLLLNFTTFNTRDETTWGHFNIEEYQLAETEITLIDR